ncbi:MAG: hypothetical protein ABR559_08740 [Gemmatimonadota bacterium]
MGNLTITVDDEALRKARIRALTQGTSVNAVLRDYLEAYAGSRRSQSEAMTGLLALSRSSTARRGDRRWTREDLHDRG